MSADSDVLLPLAPAESSSSTNARRRGMSSMVGQAVQPLEIVFRNLSFTVIPRTKLGRKKPAREKRILDNMTGIFRPGRLTVIMGPSGAGKTSLLDAVAGNQLGGTISGAILVNGEDFGLKRMREISGFVFQDDVLMDTMTAEEAIKMSAILRLPDHVRHAERKARVSDMLNILHLQECRNTQIGNPEKKGISGGERKRVCTAMELVANPPVLFLDEPTSGLDTFTAFTVVKSLRKMAHEQGRTVVATIHQPNSDIFQLFDDLVLLYAGRVVYCGPCMDAVPYFERLGYHFPMYSNPADFLFMDVMRPGASPARKSLLLFARGHTEHSLANLAEEQPVSAADDGVPSNLNNEADIPTNPISTGVECLADLWEASPEAEKLRGAIEVGNFGGVSVEMLRRRAPWYTQVSFLFKRAAKNALRNKFIIGMQIFISAILGLMVGLIYIDSGSYPPATRVRNFAGIIYFFVLSAFFRGVFGVLNIFYAEKAVFYRDYQAGYYMTAPYFFTKFAVELPVNFLTPYLTVIIAYYMVGLTPAFSSYLMVATFAALSSLCGISLGLLLGSIFDDFRIVLAVTPMLVLPLMLYSGIFIANGTLPGYLNWIKYVSPLYYGFVGSMQVQFSDTLPNCDSSVDVCDGQAILNQFGLGSVLPIGVDVVFQITLWIAYTILAYLVLELRVHIRFRNL